MATAYKHAAIPTKYRGVQFRSRLEARWAAMFDMMNWRWEYEPFDAAGYIPDFVITNYDDLIVEVKPFNLMVNNDDGAGNEDWKEVASKITTAGITSDFLIVGSRIHRIDDIYHCQLEPTKQGAAIIGFFDLECLRKTLGLAIAFSSPAICPSCKHVLYWPACFGCAKLSCNKGLLEEFFTKHPEAKNIIDTRKFGTDPVLVPHQDMMDVWNEAGNIVQYKGGR